MYYHEYVLRHLNKTFPEQGVLRVALCSHIEIRGLKDTDYLNEVIEMHENSQGEMVEREGKGIKKNWQKKKSGLILSC